MYQKRYKPRDPVKIKVENEKKAFYNAVRKFGSKVTYLILVTGRETFRHELTS